MQGDGADVSDDGNIAPILKEEHETTNESDVCGVGKCLWSIPVLTMTAVARETSNSCFVDGRERNAALGQPKQKMSRGSSVSEVLLGRV
jgi:hypothetical protein